MPRACAGRSYQSCFSYNPTSKPTLVNNIYVEHLLETAQDEMVKQEIRLVIMDERMRREECILATSPHKVVANAVRYARAMNYSLNSLLEKRLKLLHQEFEQEFRRIVDVQQAAYKDNPNYYRQSLNTAGYTRKQFKRNLSEVLTTKRRENELRQAKTQLSLPTSPSLSRQTSPTKARLRKNAWHKKQAGLGNGLPLADDAKVAAMGPQHLTISSWKHDGDAVYFPPI